MDIIYVHHAHRLHNGKTPQEDGLTKVGIKDAKNTQKLISDFKSVKAIYCSPFLRCKKTAQIINKKLNVPIIEDDRLNEYKSFENETWADCQQRVMDCLNDIYNEYDNKDAVICVTSGVNIAGFINWAYGINASNNTPFIMVPSCSPMGFRKEK